MGFLQVVPDTPIRWRLLRSWELRQRFGGPSGVETCGHRMTPWDFADFRVSQQIEFCTWLSTICCSTPTIFLWESGSQSTIWSQYLQINPSTAWKISDMSCPICRQMCVYFHMMMFRGNACSPVTEREKKGTQENYKTVEHRIIIVHTKKATWSVVHILFISLLSVPETLGMDLFTLAVPIPMIPRVSTSSCLVKSCRNHHFGSWFSAFGLMNSPFYLLIVNQQVLGQVILSMFLILNSFHYHPVLATHLPTPQWRLEVRAAFTRERRPQVG